MGPSIQLQSKRKVKIVLLLNEDQNEILILWRTQKASEEKYLFP